MRPSFRTTIGADPGEVAGVNAAFASFADAHAVPVAIRRSVNVVLDELLTNIIVHGFAGRNGGAVTIDAELFTDRLAVTLSDDGKPFNPLDVTAPDTAVPLGQRPPGGLGVHLVRQMMDEVGYQRRGDRNVITLTKFLGE